MNQNKLLLVLVGCMLLATIGFSQGQRIWLKTTPPIGTYGMAYNTANGRLYYLNFYSKRINIVSADSLLTSFGTIPAPNNDSACSDIKYCAYDNTFWVINNWRKTIYKISTSGSVLRSFSSPATDYPCGLAWDEATRTLFISDRRTQAGVTQYIYVIDTLGRTLRRMNHPVTVQYGTRCLAFQPQTDRFLSCLVNVYTYFGGGTLDSAGVFALDPQTARVLNYFRVQTPSSVDSCNIRGAEFDPRNRMYWLSYFQYGT